MPQKKYGPFEGKTYSLFGADTDTEEYYRTIRQITDTLLRLCPDEKKLLAHVQRPGTKKSRRKKEDCSDELVTKTLRDTLSVYTKGVKKHLKTLPLTKRFDETLKTKEEEYHRYMLEIELTNRIYKEPFKQSEYKFALLAHCLRDFRPKCESVPGDIEAICKHCTKECFINLGSALLKKYNIHPYISIEMDQERLFEKLKTEHPSIGGLGVACVPELAQGMRLCIKLGISPVGIPLDANRCARWMKKAQETAFSMKELEALLQ